jgi:uncharacterized protein (DUF885 family)
MAKELVMRVCLLVALCVLPAALSAQQPRANLDRGRVEDAPALSSLVAFARGQSELRVAVSRYLEDRAAIQRRYEVDYSPVRHERLRRFYQDWQRRLGELDFAGLSAEAQIDYVLIESRVRYDLDMLALSEKRWSQIAPLVPFADGVRLLQETRHDRKRANPREAAATLDRLAGAVAGLTAALSEDTRRANGLASRSGITRGAANRAAAHVSHLRDVLADWQRFYRGYDPLFTWWAAGPYERLHASLTGYAAALKRDLAGIKPGEIEPIIGDPVFEAGLAADLAVEMIPYTAEELLAIGTREFEWIEKEFQVVSHQMGFGANWKAALEHVKNLAPPPGDKPWVIFDIAKYSEEFVERMDAVTVPPLAAEVWRLEMQTAERQLINPFFQGGEVTRVSYPTDAMTYADKMMSMRGNTPHFNFATVHHELIPGHHLQAFMTTRFNPHRWALTSTPFWREGWSLYWELLLWQENFPRGSEDKIGMLFWRLHRAARIIFSLNFQLGRWTPQEAVTFLVDRVGHERANAEAEVRRSAEVAPLYQVAYMIGGLQFRALREELVTSGRMTERQFHDAILQAGAMPLEMVRARLTGQKLQRNYRAQWRFAGEPLKK